MSPNPQKTADLVTFTEGILNCETNRIHADTEFIKL